MEYLNNSKSHKQLSMIIIIVLPLRIYDRMYCVMLEFCFAAVVKLLSPCRRYCKDIYNKEHYNEYNKRYLITNTIVMIIVNK